MEYFVTCAGIPVHVSDSGKGDKAIVLLHGYLETLYIWEEFGKLLPGSSRIVSIDLPGLGLSGSDPFVNTMHFHARVLLDLLDKLCIMRPVIVGHSLGGYVGQCFLGDYPSRVAALVNFNSNPYSDDPSKASDRQKEVDFILNGKLMQLAQIVIPNMYSKSNLRKCDEKITETVEICETHDPQGVAAVVRGMAAREDNVTLLNASDVPVLFVYGDSDHYYPFGAVEKMKSDLPSCGHVIVPQTGHISFVEDPVNSSAVLLDFINKAGC